jgi:uncharacterized protein YdeI (YjbR/CyaY-like superfamily)
MGFSTIPTLNTNPAHVNWLKSIGYAKGKNVLIIGGFPTTDMQFWTNLNLPDAEQVLAHRNGLSPFL